MANSSMTKINMVNAINLALRQEMTIDKSIIVMGEDVGRDGGVFRVTEGLLDTFGADRVLDTPLAESAILGTALGMAVAGLKPVAEMQFDGFSFLMFPQLETTVSRIRSRSQGVFNAPLVVRVPYGGGVRALEHHSESPEATFSHIAGVKVVVPSGPRNARALLVAAIRDPDPVIFLEPKHSYRAWREDVPDEVEVGTIGKAEVVQPGEDITVISWGAMMRPVLHAIEALQKSSSTRIELIDLLTMSPLDEETIVESVKKTGRCVIVQESHKSLGMASEIIARINDGAFLYLKAPVKRVSGYDVVTPYFGRENHFIPGPARIARAIEETLKF